MMSVGHCNNKGFTLLEVMIALAIVATAMVALLGLSNRSILVQERIQRLTRATLLAQQVMSEQEIAATGSRQVWDSDEGVFAEPYAEFRWQISYQDTLITKVKQVQVSVLWGEAEKNEQVQLVSFLPTDGGP